VLLTRSSIVSVARGVVLQFSIFSHHPPRIVFCLGFFHLRLSLLFNVMVLQIINIVLVELFFIQF
jgi:hypothetical protein